MISLTGVGAIASSGYSLPAQLLIGQMSTPPTQARAELINQTILSLINEGLWAKTDVLWITAAADSQAASLNWKSPTLYSLTAVNSPTFATDRGYTGNGTTSYLATGWIANTNGVQYQQNSAHYAAWCRTNAQSTSALTGADRERLTSRNASDFLMTRGQAGAVNTGTVASTSIGHKLVNRNNSANYSTSSNGAALETITQASVATSGNETYICCINNSGTPGFLTTRQICAVHYGAALTSGEITAYNNILQTYMTAVGA